MAELHYLGHSAFLLKTDKLNILIDPFIKGNKFSPVTVDKLKDIDVILVTHGHDDHLGDAVEIAKRNESKIICIFDLVKRVKNAVPMNIGGTIELAEDIYVSMVQAFHSSNSVGFVISINGTGIYHAGDTGIFSDMGLISKLYDVEIALLPIGGVYTMGVQEAVIATQMIKPRIVVPMHYDTWPQIEVDTKVFARLIKEETDATPKVMKPGDKLII
jgi:L-ascorbate metabolism protein UlaG (beta-lactamase superfamily)